MNCPHGHGTLLRSERQGVEIDYCPQCRGVWLDRGELDKIVERSAAEEEGRGVGRDRDDGRRDDDRDRERHSDDRYPGERRDDPRNADDPRYAKKKKKRTSFLEDLFEF
jgi:Zn-finger nucleic acid-binding protein